MNRYKTALISGLLLTSTAFAHEATAIIQATSDNKQLGTITFTQSQYGVLITPKLSGLTQGLHGLHLHQHPNCGDHGNDAKGHFDPQNTNTHKGPYDNGHLGDLPALYVDANGQATTQTLAPRLKLQDLQNLAVMIHEHGDNYSDTPPLGGGGARIACGIATVN